jgi:hypothetical protein
MAAYGATSGAMVYQSPDFMTWTSVGLLNSVCIVLVPELLVSLVVALTK